MVDETRRLSKKVRSFLLLAAVLTALATLSLLANGETNAQTSSSAVADPPALNVVSASTTAVELSWTLVSDAVSYDLRTWWAGADGWQRIDDGSLKGTSYSHQGVTVGRKYFYIVAGVDDDGRRGPWSPQVEVTVPASDALTSTPTSTATPTITVLVTSTPTPTLTVLVTSTPTSTPLVTSTPTATPTAMPTAAALTAPGMRAEVGAGEITLRWGEVADADSYRIIVWYTSLPDWQAIGGVLRGTSYVHRGLNASTTYHYHVLAVAAGGAESAWSERVSAVPSASVSLTQTPTPTATAIGLSAPALQAEAGAGEITLTWGAVANADSYQLIFWDRALSDWRGIGGVLRGTSYTHGGLTGGTTHYYHVRAVAASGAVSAWSVQVSAVVEEATTATPTRTSTPTPEFTPTVATTQRGALIALYEATDGENWRDNDNWLTDAPLDSWYGVSADRLGRVSRLRLSGNELNGHIPDLSALVDLEILSLSFNTFPGPFPDLSALASLTQLALQDNEITGPIPDLSAFSSLRYLWLGRNLFTGSIPDGDALPNLITLDLSRNRLTGMIPPGMANLLDLQSLTLSGNSLTGCIPASLQFIRTHDLDEVGLPYCDEPTPTPGPTPTPATTEKGALIALFEATGGANWTDRRNWLTDEPISQWYGVTTDSSGGVTQLDLRSNRLTGEIPDLRSLTQLEYLKVAGNDLVGPVPTFDGLSKLRHLDLTNNELSGNVPDLSALTNLTDLYLDGNRLTGQIPDLSEFANLSSLFLSNNELSGPIPDLSTLTNLTRLYLGSNQLTGQIPDLGALTELRELILSGNMLTGSMPNLGALTKLKYLYLGSNQLSGQIPDLGTLSDLRELSLSGNQFTGQIPSLSAFTKLGGLDLSNNQLSGQIPNVDALRNIDSLNLAGNQLTGPIPELSNLAKLGNLDLGNNQLTGLFPDLSNQTELWSLDLTNNKLTGPILNLHLLPELVSIHIENNDLTGPMPVLSTLTELLSVRLQGNSLCLPAGQSLSHPNSRVADQLSYLNPPACTDAELMAIVGVPQNLATAVGDGQVTLTWNTASNAVSYELRAWDSFDQQWDSIGGVLTASAYTHAVRTDGRNYLYQVRAVGASDIHSWWSERVYAVLAPTQFPPPPLSLAYDLIFQKHLEVDGVYVVAPSEVTDERMVQARAIITGMLANRPELLDTMAYYNTTIYLDDDADPLAFRIELSSEELWGANVPETETYCSTFLHEFAHVVLFALEDQADGEEFKAKLQSLYDAALTAGLWKNRNASTNPREYWAEIVKFRFEESVVVSQGTTQLKLEDYDSEAAKLVEEVFGDATVPSDCKR